MSLSVKSTHLTFSAPEIEERGYLSPEELDYIPSDLNIKIVRTLQSHSLQMTSLPQGLSSLRFIHVVDLSGTQIRGEDLEHLPPRIRELSVEDCEEIEMLPASLKELEFLSTLNASKTYIRNESLNNLPDSLEVLKIESCKRISELPESLSSLRFIHVVDLSGTQIRGEDLEHLPPRIRELKVEDCEEIEMLPASLKALEFLSILNASKTYIQNDSLNNLPVSLEVLRIESCIRISKIPETFFQMKNLKAIHMAKTKVDYLDNLPRTIEKIDARQCPVEHLGGSFHERAHLHEIYLSYKYFDVDSLRSIAANIWPEYIQLKTISIDRESAITFYKRFNMRSFQKSGFNEEQCVKLIKKHALKLNNVSIIIE